MVRTVQRSEEAVSQVDQVYAYEVGLGFQTPGLTWTVPPTSRVGAVTRTGLAVPGVVVVGPPLGGAHALAAKAAAPMRIVRAHVARRCRVTVIAVLPLPGGRGPLFSTNQWTRGTPELQVKAR